MPFGAKRTSTMARRTTTSNFPKTIVIHSVHNTEPTVTQDRRSDDSSHFIGLVIEYDNTKMNHEEIEGNNDAWIGNELSGIESSPRTLARTAGNGQGRPEGPPRRWEKDETDCCSSDPPRIPQRKASRPSKTGIHSQGNSDLALQLNPAA